MTDIRKVGRRFINVRNPDYTIKKEYPDDNEKEKEVWEKTIKECPICSGEGSINLRTELNPRARSSDICWGCGGSGKLKDYLNKQKDKPKKNPYADIEDEYNRKKYR